jgi:predicted  nucleic acid-binding Zn-ribbon protein
MSEVGAATEAKLRNAMERLLNGTAINSDGRLTKSNLAKEDGVSRATTHRANALLAEWDELATTRAPLSKEFHKVEEQLTKEKAKTRQLRDKVRQLEGQLSSAVTIMLEMQTIISEQSRSSTVSSIGKSQSPGS